MEIDLLEKTELWIENVTLQGADLNRIAEAAADVLQLERSKVLVVDVRETHLTLDILQHRLQAEQVFGKKEELLRALSHIPGVNITEATEIHSDGILGMIALEPEHARVAIHRGADLAAGILSRVARRACVFATGFEVKRGMIKDTNTALIRETLEAHGFKVTPGEVLDDDRDLIAGRIRKALGEGFGLIVTTGGVGAEDKDRTVEAVLKVDPGAATPYIVHFEKGTGRHEKDGVKIAVGQAGNTLIAALPGPNDEVKIGIAILLAGLERGLDKTALADDLARALREKLRQKHHSHTGENHG